MIRQRCLAGLIISSMASAVFCAAVANAQTAQPAPIGSEQQVSPSVQPHIEPKQEDAVAAPSTSPAPEHSSDVTAETQSGPRAEPPNSAGTNQPQQTPPNAVTATDSKEAEPSIAPQSGAPGKTEANSAEPDILAEPASSGTPQPNADQPAIIAQPKPPAEPAIDPKDVTLRIATWGGAYGQSQERAFFKPFTKRYGYRIESVIYDGAYEDLIKQGDEPKWSLVDLNGEAMLRACDEGRLERLDFSILEASPDGAPLSEDFFPGAIHPCGVASVAWSTVIVYDKDLSTPPVSLDDFFDTGKIPGKRLLPKQPRYSLELALMADGVAPDQVYATLTTQEGQDRAFRKLSSIKDDIVWWEAPSEVFSLLAKHKAIMGVAFNGRAFMAKVGSQQPIEFLWDHQIYSFDYWSIPRGAPFPQAAKDFIRFATSSGPLSDQARWIPYGPARRSALTLVGKHVELDLDMKPFLPTYEPNFVKLLAFDGAFWAIHGEGLKQRFADWAEGRQLPSQKAAAISP